jgi:hypothetical protein
MLDDLITEAHALMNLAERGPTNPKAMFRVGSKPNQSTLLKSTRDFLALYAAAGNKALQHQPMDLAALERAADLIKAELGDLLQAAKDLNR